MNIQTHGKEVLEKFELVPTGTNLQKGAEFITQKRMLIGSSEACDIIIPIVGVSAIHAVVEINGSSVKIYDMNSTNGTFINGIKIVAQKLNLDDEISFAKSQYKLKKYNLQDGKPLVLDMLKEAKRKKASKMLPPELPRGQKTKNKEIESIPKVEYPLSKDPNADKIEYIFEDSENLYPIFKYEIEKSSVEVIVLFENKIFSVDYLPDRDGLYKLVGINPRKNEMEYSYLGKGQKVPFVENKGSETFIHLLEGYDRLLLSDKGDNNSLDNTGIYTLSETDILRFSLGKIQIFVRRTQKPPKVKSAPIITRDNDLKKLIFLFLFSTLLFLIGINSYEIDRELEKENLPERIATILYKKKLTTSKNKAISKTEKAPKVIQLSKKSSQDVKKKKTPKIDKIVKEKVKKNKKIVKKVGKKIKVTNQKIKKVKPKKSNKNNLVNKVTKKAGKSSRKLSKNKSSRKSSVKASSRGHVDTYKALNFKSSLSRLLSKGGNTKSINAATSVRSNTGLSRVETGDESATLVKAKVSHKVGSLTGSASGKLDDSKGLEGFVHKKGIYTVGIPTNTVILGSMDPDLIRRILQQNSHLFRNCYQKILKGSTRPFNGMLPLNFVIGASGHVVKAGIRSGRGGGDLPRAVKTCVIKVLKGITFPEPLGGGSVEVNQPMNFFPKKF